VEPAGDVVSPAGFRLWLVACLLFVLAACGGTSGEGTTTTPAGSDATVDPVTTTTEPESGPGRDLDIQGHRGARGLKPENTLPAFETALDLGVSTLELDLHFTADAQVVVWHDAAIDKEKCRLTDDAPPDIPDPDDVLAPEEDRLIAHLDRAELEWYQCDRNPSKARYPEQSADPTALAGNDYRIVTLGQLFDFVDAYAGNPGKTADQQSSAARVEFNIETKRKPNNPETIGDGFDGENAGPFELAILAEIVERGLIDRVVIQSFDHRSLWAVRSENETIRLAALSVREAVDAADLAARGASIWSPNLDAVNRDSVDEAHDAGLEVIPWTVNDRTDMADLIALGVDGLITDRPDLLLDLLRAQGG
jgi:glycerophosphoryl diester phosphodiesterase